MDSLALLESIAKLKAKNKSLKQALSKNAIIPQEQQPHPFLEPPAAPQSQLQAQADSQLVSSPVLPVEPVSDSHNFQRSGSQVPLVHRRSTAGSSLKQPLDAPAHSRQASTQTATPLGNKVTSKPSTNRLKATTFNAPDGQHAEELSRLKADLVEANRKYQLVHSQLQATSKRFDEERIVTARLSELNCILEKRCDTLSSDIAQLKHNHEQHQQPQSPRHSPSAPPSELLRTRLEQQIKDLEGALEAQKRDNAQLQQENSRFRQELANLDPRFFEEIEDLKYNFQQAQLIISAYDASLVQKRNVLGTLVQLAERLRVPVDSVRPRMALSLRRPDRP